MRMVLGLERGCGETLVTVGEIFNTEGTEEHRVRHRAQINVKGSGRECPLLRNFYSRTLSSSFLRPQSAAAWTKARTTGCGFLAVEESWGWKRVAMKKRWVGDSMARISPWAPRATIGNPASMVAHSYSGLTSKLQKNSSVTTSSSLP